MSFVIAVPEYVTAAATDVYWIDNQFGQLSSIGANVERAGGGS